MTGLDRVHLCHCIGRSGRVIPVFADRNYVIASGAVVYPERCHRDEKNGTTHANIAHISIRMDFATNAWGFTTSV